MSSRLLDEDLDTFKMNVGKYIKLSTLYADTEDKTNPIMIKLDKELRKASLDYRISRARGIQTELKGELIKLGLALRDSSIKHYTDISNGVREDYGLDEISNISSYLNTKWTSGNRNFSNSIWEDMNRLNGYIDNKLISKINAGVGVAKLIKEISEEFEVSKRNAKRLVLTETAYFNNRTRLLTFKDLGIEEVEILATLDIKTSKICRHKDRVRVKVEEGQIGLNLPPFHPHCRSTFAPYMENEEDETRIARDPYTNKNYTGAVKDYGDYLKKHFTNGESDPRYKMISNKQADKKQFEKYKKILGDFVPKELAKFQELKYNHSDEYNELKARYSIKISNIEVSGKQKNHMESTKQAGKSYIPDDTNIEELLNKYKGSGELHTNNYPQIKEVITTEEYIGYDINQNTGVLTKTNKFKIHYGKLRIKEGKPIRKMHVVPFIDWEE